MSTLTRLLSLFRRTTTAKPVDELQVPCSGTCEQMINAKPVSSRETQMQMLYQDGQDALRGQGPHARTLRRLAPLLGLKSVEAVIQSHMPPRYTTQDGEDGVWQAKILKLLRQTLAERVLGDWTTLPQGFEAMDESGRVEGLTETVSGFYLDRGCPYLEFYHRGTRLRYISGRLTVQVFVPLEARWVSTKLYSRYVNAHDLLAALEAWFARMGLETRPMSLSQFYARIEEIAETRFTASLGGYRINGPTETVEAESTTDLDGYRVHGPTGVLAIRRLKNKELVFQYEDEQGRVITSYNAGGTEAEFASVMPVRLVDSLLQHAIAHPTSIHPICNN